VILLVVFIILQAVITVIAAILSFLYILSFPRRRNPGSLECGTECSLSWGRGNSLYRYASCEGITLAATADHIYGVSDLRVGEQSYFITTNPPPQPGNLETYAAAHWIPDFAGMTGYDAADKKGAGYKPARIWPGITNPGPSCFPQPSNHRPIQPSPTPWLPAKKAAGRCNSPAAWFIALFQIREMVRASRALQPWREPYRASHSEPSSAYPS